MTLKNDESSNCVVCFALGLSGEDIENGRNAFGVRSQGTAILEVVSVTPAMLDWPVGEALTAVQESSGFGVESASPEDADDASAITGSCRALMIAAMDRDLVIQIMRSFKAVLSEPQEMIFAVITDTARTWTFRDYIGHLIAEHETMKNRNC